MKYFFGYLFLFLAFLVLLVALVRPDMLEAAIITTGAVLVTLGYMLIASAGAVFTIGGGLVAWWWYRRTTVESLRQRDGHYPIQRVRVRGGAGEGTRGAAVIPHIRLGRLQVIWWPRRCLFHVWVWPDYPPEFNAPPMFRSVILWPLEFRWWSKLP